MVFGAEGFGHVDVFDVGFAVHGGEDGAGEVVPGAGATGAAVEDAGEFGVFAAVEGHVYGVGDVDEVAELLAVGVVGAVGFEEADAAVGEDLSVGLVDDGAHVALVVFVGAVDVEVFEAGDLGEDAAAEGPEVEEVLGHAIHVEGAEGVEGGFVVAVALGAVAVGGGGGGVDEAGAGFEGGDAEGFGVAGVVGDQEVGVGFGGGGAGAEVVDAGDVAEEALGDEGGEGVALDVVGEAESAEVFPVFVGSEGVDGEDVFMAAAVEFGNEVGGDEAGGAGLRIRSPTMAARASRLRRIRESRPGLRLRHSERSSRPKKTSSSWDTEIPMPMLSVQP